MKLTNEEIIERFHQIWYGRQLSWQCKWRGVQLIKCPFDLQVYQELIWNVRPTLIIETGTHAGGSALFLADMLSLTGQGRVITIDIQKIQLTDPRITFHVGSSISPETEEYLKQEITPDDTVMVILDSAHDPEFVYKEMTMYAPLVTVGSYLIVEDSNVAGHPVHDNTDSDPWQAIHKFLEERDDFVIDTNCERFLVTQNPCGYLRKEK